MFSGDIFCNSHYRMDRLPALCTTGDCCFDIVFLGRMEIFGVNLKNHRPSGDLFNLTVALLLFGIWLDHTQAPKYLRHLVPPISNNLSDLKVSYPIAIVVASLAAVSGMLILTTPLRPISAVLVSAPIVSMAWIFTQYHRQRSQLSADGNLGGGDRQFSNGYFGAN